jgi:mannose-6-phosphate isomerase-like protein (cupin superfamily)
MNVEGFELKSFNLFPNEQLTFNNKAIYIFLFEGEIRIKLKDEKYLNMYSHMYSSFSDIVDIISCSSSSGIIILSDICRPLNMIGGPIENRGRLQYIDGCSDTLLLSPSRLGEPCLNLLHFPKMTNQTMHHHPSFRFGMVVSGEGESVSLEGSIPLSKGDIFFLPDFFDHKFNTYNSEMNIIAFHPDSDWGPTDETHPMRNRTWFKELQKS